MWYTGDRIYITLLWLNLILGEKKYSNTVDIYFPFLSKIVVTNLRHGNKIYLKWFEIKISLRYILPNSDLLCIEISNIGKRCGLPYMMV